MHLPSELAAMKQRCEALEKRAQEGKAERLSKLRELSGKIDDFCCCWGECCGHAEIEAAREITQALIEAEGPQKWPRQPTSTDENEPAWKRRYFCPQCPPPGVGQPRDGFHLIEFVEHTNSHAVAYLREAVQDASRYAEAIRELESFLSSEFFAGWSVHAVRRQASLVSLRAFRHKDEAAWDEWKERWAEPKEK